jgi:hypothetical protein
MSGLCATGVSMWRSFNNTIEAPGCDIVKLWSERFFCRFAAESSASKQGHNWLARYPF